RRIAELDARHPGKKTRLAISRWGVCHPEATAEGGMEQPSTIRDAILAASFLNTLNENAARVGIACLGEAVNAAHCLMKTKGREMILTPTYHVFDLMTPHKGARLVYHELKGPKMSLPRNRQADLAS